jgi:hypothetical protein
MGELTLQYVIQDSEVVGHATGQYKQVPYAMEVIFFYIEDVKNDANAIEQATSQQPEKTGHRQ